MPDLVWVGEQAWERVRSRRAWQRTRGRCHGRCHLSSRVTSSSTPSTLRLLPAARLDRRHAQTHEHEAPGPQERPQRQAHEGRAAPLHGIHDLAVGALWRRHRQDVVAHAALPDSTMPPPAMGRFGLSLNRFKKLRSVLSFGPLSVHSGVAIDKMWSRTWPCPTRRCRRRRWGASG